MHSDLLRRRDELALLLAQENHELRRAVDATEALVDTYRSLGAVLARHPAPLLLAAFAAGFALARSSR